MSPEESGIDDLGKATCQGLVPTLFKCTKWWKNSLETIPSMDSCCMLTALLFSVAGCNIHVALIDRKIK